MTLSQRAILLLLSFFTSALFALTPTAWETASHVPVLFYPTHNVPMLTIHIGFKAGSAYDQKQFGLAAFTAAMLNQGNAGLTASEMADQMAETGALFSSNPGRDLSAVSLTTLTEPKAMEASIELFNRILTQADFPLAAFNQQKSQQLALLRHENESPDAIGMNLFFNRLYEGHPYGHDVYGTNETVQALTSKDLKQFYNQYYIQENATIVMVGNIDETEARALSESLLNHLPHGKRAPDIPEAKPLTKAAVLTEAFPSAQTALYFGQLGINHHSPDYFPLIVGNYILGGGGLTSLLAKEVREAQGLTYGISSEFMPMTGKGPFIIKLSTKNDQADKALSLTQSITGYFIQHGPSEEALREAKAYLTGSFPLSLTSNASIAAILLKMGFYHLPLDFLDTYIEQVNAVSAKDIQTAFSNTLSSSAFLSVSVGPAAK